MDVETAALVDTAALWLPSGTFDAEGTRKVTAGVEVDCRWEDRKGEFRNPEGEPVAYDAWVALDTDAPVGSIMREGTLAAATAALAADPPRRLYEVIDFRKVKDVRGQATRREVRLARYRETMPEVVA